MHMPDEFRSINKRFYQAFLTSEQALTGDHNPRARARRLSLPVLTESPPRARQGRACQQLTHQTGAGGSHTSKADARGVLKAGATVTAARGHRLP